MEGDNCQTLENGQGRIWVVGEYGFLRHANLEIPLCSHILGKPSLDLEGKIQELKMSPLLYHLK